MTLPSLPVPLLCAAILASPSLSWGQAQENLDQASAIVSEIAKADTPEASSSRGFDAAQALAAGAFKKADPGSAVAGSTLLGKVEFGAAGASDAAPADAIAGVGKLSRPLAESASLALSGDTRTPPRRAPGSPVLNDCDRCKEKIIAAGAVAAIVWAAVAANHAIDRQQPEGKGFIKFSVNGAVAVLLLTAVFTGLGWN